MQNSAIVPKGINSGFVYKCKSHIYRSFEFGKIYHEQIKDLMTSTPVSEWTKSHPDDWQLVGEL